MCVPSNIIGKFGVVNNQKPRDLKMRINNQKPRWRPTNYDVVTRINIAELCLIVKRSLTKISKCWTCLQLVVPKNCSFYMSKIRSMFLVTA